LEIRVIVDYRGSLLVEGTRLQSRVRWHLVALAPDLEAQIPAGALHRARWRAWIAERLAAAPASARVEIVRRQLARLVEITDEAHELEATLKDLVENECPALLELFGCGVVTAATLIGHVGDARRFSSDSQFARLAGTAPVPSSSGERERLHLDRGGDRQLNAALHRIALVQSIGYPAARDYLARKQSEAMSRRRAMRCLKRHLARRVWQLLKTAAPERQPRLDPAYSNTGALNRTGTARPWHAPETARRTSPNDSSVLADALALEAVIRERIRARLDELAPAITEYEECRAAAHRLALALPPH
jgi:transposase